MRTYAHEIGRIDGLPYGAAETGPPSCVTPPEWSARCASGCPGRYGARCAFAATGPTPGPPPPCGMQNVLCRLRCETSPPKSPNRAKPSSALRFAPST